MKRMHHLAVWMMGITKKEIVCMYQEKGFFVKQCVFAPYLIGCGEYGQCCGCLGFGCAYRVSCLLCWALPLGIGYVYGLGAAACLGVGM